MYDLIPYVSTMNDSERLIFEGNLRRLKNNLESHGLIKGENVSSDIISIQPEADQRKLKRRESERGPVNQEGLMGTNVATGIFSKPKEGKLAKDFLVSDTIGNPFEIDYFKGRSREDILISAEAQLKMIDDETINLSKKLLNENLKLTQEQQINLAKNLETKKRFKKDFEAFKTKPEAEVLNIETGKKVEDIEALKEKSGLVAPPTSSIGKIDLMNKQMLQKVDDLFPSEATLQKEEAKRQALIAKQYEGKGYAGGTFGPSGMYRSVARDFLLDQNAKGIIKLDSGVVKALEDRAYISGGQPLMYPDPIRVMRFHYGDNVFDKIPLDKIKTGAKSEILDAMSKVEVNPVKTGSPATPGGYMTPGEIKANIDELKGIENMVKRRESRFADMTEEQIQNELEQYGSKRSSFEMAFQYDHPKEYEQYLKLNNPKEYYKAQEMKKITPLNEPSKPYKPFGSDFTKQEKVDWLIKNVDQEAKVTIPSPEFLQNMLDSGREDLIDHFWEIHTKNIGRKPVIDIDTSNLKNPALVRAMMEERASKPKLVYSKEDSVDDAGKVNKDNPEKFAKGGSVGAMGLDYLTGQEPPKNGYAGGGRIGFEKGTVPRMLKFLIDKLADEKDFNRKLLERSNPKAVQDLYIEKYGKLPSAEEIKDIVNKQLQNKGSMEVTNPKTGEVTTTKEPVTIAEKKYFYDKDEEYNKLIVKHKKAAEAHDQLDNIDIYDKIAPDQLGDVIAEMAGKNVDTLTDAQRRKYYTEAQTYLTDFIKIDRTRRAVEKVNNGLELTATDRNYLKFAEPETKSTYKQGDIITSENFGDTPFAPDLSGLEEARKMAKGMSLHDEMNMVLNQYDKSMFIKNEQGLVDVTNPENVQKMALLLQRDHPELYKKLEGGAQTNVLEDFDITGRKPNAMGGRIGFEKGSIPEEEDEEPSEEYIKSKEAGRSKYSFDVQGPDSRTRKSGLPGRTNPKDYGLGITYLSNSGNETAPEIRVGGSRRGVGVEIRKRFKEGGLGYLVGE